MATGKRNPREGDINALIFSRVENLTICVAFWLCLKLCYGGLSLCLITFYLCGIMKTLQGDFLVHFMDIAREELTKKMEEISVEKLQVA